MALAKEERSKKGLMRVKVADSKKRVLEACQKELDGYQYETKLEPCLKQNYLANFENCKATLIKLGEENSPLYSKCEYLLEKARKL